jgi:hypothetical protein
VQAEICAELTPRTARVSRRLTASAIANEELIDVLARRVAEAAARNQAPPPPPDDGHRKFLGFNYKNWLGWGVKGLIVVIVFLVAWYKTVNQELASKASQSDVDQRVQEHVGNHEKHGDHADINAALNLHSVQLQKMSDIQIRQTVILENQERAVREIQADIKPRHRRQR